ncbi:MAG: hybrid sensor histidine kinase/response regulator [Propionivibrio sp.]
MLPRDIAVLVVDDLESMRAVTSAQLRALGIERISVAGNGAEALQILQHQTVTIVLSDWNMPVMSGLELLKAIRGDARLGRLPFVMITAETERRRIEEAIAGGVSDLIVKPYTAGDLADRVEKALRWKPRANPLAESDLPFVPSPHAPTPSGPPAEATAKDSRSTILIVDDVPDNLHLLFHLFKDEYRVRIAHNGTRALNICSGDSPPDLVLLDIMMPDMDGFEVLRRMRGHPNAEMIPVIFVTAMNGDEARMKGLELGAVNFVSKPIIPELLKPRVRNFMRYVELRRELQASYDEMLAVARLRDDVEAITRHDLKGPLAGVIGLAQSLADDDMLTNRQLEQLRLIEEAALQALNMVNLSTDLYNIESGRFVLEAKPVVIGDILRRIVEMARASYAEKRIVIAVNTDVPVGSEPPVAEGDSMLCYSLFQNLLKNACEAAPPNSRVSVILSDETPLRITLQNRGVVPPTVRERFFEKFVTAGKQGGSGLGTYSAKLLAVAQHGDVEMLTSDEDDTTTLTVFLPRPTATSVVTIRQMNE